MLLLFFACTGKDDSSAADDSSTPGGRRFAGAIVDHATGDPISDADVCLNPGNVCQQTSADGSFTLLSDRDDDDEFVLLVAEPGWVALTVPYPVPKGDAPDGVFEMWGEDLVPDSTTTATLVVTVVDADGDPVAGRTVSVEGADDLATDGSGVALFLQLADDANATIELEGTCTDLYAWDSLGGDAFRANLEIGRLFSTRLRCE
jgi:hypothetical protein